MANDPPRDEDQPPVLVGELEIDNRPRWVDLSTIRDIRRSYAACVRLALAGRLSTADLTRLGYAHKVLADLVEVEVLDTLKREVADLKKRFHARVQ